MPTPVGHSLAGLAVRIAAPRSVAQQRIASSVLLIVLANLPDIDFLPGYVSHDPRAYHWGPTHSVGATLIAASTVALIARWRGQRWRPWCALAALAYGSHVVLDLLMGRHAGPGVGLQVLWPFSDMRYMAPWSVFRMAPSAMVEYGPLHALFSREILPVIAREFIVLLPIVLITWWWQRSRQTR